MSNFEVPSLEKRLALTQCPRGPHVMYQDWEHLLFAHWEWDPEEIQKTLPPGLTVDTFEEKAYLGLVPFYMNKIRPRFFPAIPGLSWFLEMNLRTYVYDEQGRAGVWFYSLDCNQPLAVMVARKSYRLPYEHATMRAELQDSWVNYHSTRQATGDHTHIRYRGVSEIQTAFPGSLEFFLAERYVLFVYHRNKLYTGRVYHTPYPLQKAEVSHFNQSILQLNGFKTDRNPDLFHYAPGVHVKIFALPPNP